MNRFLTGIFMLSGVAGLIYESIWSHYIKLLLGHAAYAQSLVLIIFMGGMAIGAWLVSRQSPRLRNLLLAYCVVEILIGILGIGFHPVFEAVSTLLLDSVIPAVGSSSLVTFIKIGVAALLILPQSILLGATFPLMSGAIIRRWPGSTGASIAILYFANSLGAVFGVLWSGFWLIEKVGLPGALLTAGLINIVIAILVYLPTKTPERTAPIAAAGSNAAPMAWLLWAAAITGAASFCYEIAWIRMLSMVLGASTHSFELMLAAFILGLALGGLWIKRRIDSIDDPRRFLGKVQIFMGILALLTLPLYNYTFDMMSQMMQGLARTEQGYVLFSLTGHAIALLVMLPATFCAGMTLPLLTLLLWRQGSGETALGRIYAANTLGAIIGVTASVHLIMPLLGLKYLMIIGALMDGALGIYLLGQLKPAWRLRDVMQRGWAIGFACILLAIALTSALDAKRMGSSVYRTAASRLGDNVEILRWADGKTASIGLARANGEQVFISTNGKTDAALNLGGKEGPSPDEYTMMLAGVIPLMYTPDIKEVANVGFGSGLTTHTLLAHPGIRQIDTVEIEAEMIKSARLGFEKRVSRAFTDARSQIHIEDARVYFAKHGKRYDLIVAEPSNPWVSGVASLFSVEYYRHVQRYLAPNGLFVQWLQLYETDITVAASVLSALNQVFADWHLYTTADGDMLIIASPKTRLVRPTEASLTPELLAELKLLRLNGWVDLHARYLGDKALWGPWLTRLGVPVNSDYFPFVDLNAARFRFIGSSVQQIRDIRNYPVPVLEILDPSSGIASVQPLGPRNMPFWTADRIAGARDIRDAVLTGKPESLLPGVQGLLALLRNTECPTEANAQIVALHTLSEVTTPYLDKASMDKFWNKVEDQSPCLKRHPILGRWLKYHRALGARDAKNLASAASALLDLPNASIPPQALEHVVVAEMAAYLANDDASGFSRAQREHLEHFMKNNRLPRLPVAADFLLGHAAAKGWKI